MLLIWAMWRNLRLATDDEELGVVLAELCCGWCVPLVLDESRMLLQVLAVESTPSVVFELAASSTLSLKSLMTAMQLFRFCFISWSRKNMN
jgi:hypothetical protein